MDSYLKLKEIINNSKNIVVFTGAGISTESGIPDFRSSNGLYIEKFRNNISPEKIISHSFFIENPDVFYDFYFKKMIYKNAKPNIAHYFVKNLEEKSNVTVVTQNIDDLHNQAGSKNVIELHGSIKRNYCMKCNKFYDIKDLNCNGIPLCNCGGIIKPDVVLYEEALDEANIDNAIKAIANADTLIVIGTSLAVYPAASFVRYFKGNNLVLLNKSKTQYDIIASLVINENICDIVKKIK